MIKTFCQPDMKIIKIEIVQLIWLIQNKIKQFIKITLYCRERTLNNKFKL